MITLGLDVALAPIGALVGITGIGLFLWGFSTKPDEIGLSPEEIAAWKPTDGKLPESGRVMYRIDTTLDEPLKTTILCGSCGEIATIDGSRPFSWDCPSCGIFLWQGEEE